MKVVISGSFRKSLPEIIELKEQLEEKGIEVLNPKTKNTIVNLDDPTFVLFQGEEDKNKLELEKKYIESIANSNAHIIYISNGYLGETAFSELLFSCCCGIPVYLTEDIKTIYCNNTPQSIGIYMALQNLISNGIIKIGINNMLKDFNLIGHQLKKTKNDE